MEELINLHGARGGFYSFCSTVFLNPPNEDMLKVLEDTVDAVDEISRHNVEMKASSGRIKNFFSVRNSIKDEKEKAEYDLEALRQYTSLFCLLDSVPMAESYYTSTEKLVMQESRDKMLDKLRKYSFVMSDNLNEFEDHIGIELAFMANLAELSVVALEEQDTAKYNELMDEQKAFHEEHFAVWIDQFAAKVGAFGSQEVLYKAVTVLTSEFIKEDKAILDELNYL